MRSLNLDQLRAFVEVVAHGNFTAAAKELNMSQPAVTHQIQELESRLNVTLVERLGMRGRCWTRTRARVLTCAGLPMGGSAESALEPA